MKKNPIAIFLPADIKEKNNSAVARIEMFKYLKNINFDIYHFGNVGPYYSEASPKNLSMYYKILKKFKRNHFKNPYQLIWATLTPIIMALFASRFRKLFKIPLIIDVRDPGISSVVLKYSKNNWRFKIAKKIEKWIYSQADKICAVTPELKTFISKQFEIPSSKIEIISNATTFKQTNKTPIKKEFQVFFGGNFAPYQVIDKVLKNIARNKKHHDSFVFSFYGYNPKKQPELLRIIKENHLDGFVKLNPAIERQKLFKKLSESHIALVPISGLNHPELYDYAIPLKFYEALSYSKPILLYVGTKASKNALKRHQIGLTCSDNENIFDKLKQLKKNYDYYQSNCQKTIYLRQKEAMKLEKIINKLLLK